MDALFFGAMGIGVWLMWAAYKNEHPWQLFQTVLSQTTKG